MSDRIFVPIILDDTLNKQAVVESAFNLELEPLYKARGPMEAKWLLGFDL